MQNFYISLINFISMMPVIYLAGVVFTASSFSWMKSLVNEYRYDTEWPYIIIILINGIIPTLLAVSETSVISTINPAIIVVLTPIFAILEFALLSRDSVTTYIFFLGMIMLQFACFFGIGATAITSVKIPESIITADTIRSATMTFSLFLLSFSLSIFNLISKSTADVLKRIVHDWDTGIYILLYMIINGVVLGIATGFDYKVYFSDAASNPFRTVTIAGMILRYLLILTTSMMLVYVQCKLEINRKKAAQFEAASNTDPLTGLLNRSGMDKAMSRLSSVYSGDDTSMEGALIMLDLDHFKSVNDNLGHPVGDEMLIKASQVISNAFRDSDYVCRLGGDEFCVFFNGYTTEDTIRKKCELLNESLRFNYPIPSGGEINTSTSIGVALFPKHGCNYKDLYKSADKALYTSKENGRNCFIIAK